MDNELETIIKAIVATIRSGGSANTDNAYVHIDPDLRESPCVILVDLTEIAKLIIAELKLQTM